MGCPYYHRPLRVQYNFVLYPAFFPVSPAEAMLLLKTKPTTEHSPNNAPSFMKRYMLFPFMKLTSN